MSTRRGHSSAFSSGDTTGAIAYQFILGSLGPFFGLNLETVSDGEKVAWPDCARHPRRNGKRTA